MHQSNLGRVFVIPVSFAALLAAGCGSDDSSSGSPGGGGVNSGGLGGATGGSGGATGGAAGAAGAGGSAGESVEVVVNELIGAALPGLNNPPILGATVAADLPGGTRVEYTSDANGKVTITGVDWSKGRLSITTYAKDHVMGSWLGIDKSTLTAVGGKLAASIGSSKPPTLVQVSGAVKGSNASSDLLSIYSTGPGVYEKKPGGLAYALPVWPNAPFSLIGVDHNIVAKDRTLTDTIYGWSRIDHTAVTGPLSLDFDFANKLTPTTVSGTAKLPGPVDSVVHQYSQLFVFASPEGREMTTTFCWPTSSAPNVAGDAIDYTAQYVTISDLGEIYTRYELRTFQFGGPNVDSIIYRKGYPQSSEVVDGFLDQFTITKPSDPKAAAPLHDPIEFTTSDKQTSAFVALRRGTAQPPYWIAWTSDLGATSLTLPELPSTAVADGLLGGTPIVTDVVLRSDYDPQKNRFANVLAGNTITLQP